MADNGQLLSSCRIKNQVIKEFLAEMLGTFILVLVCDCSIAVQVLKSTKSHDIDILAVGFATGMALMLCFYGASKLSGGHVNPVVTLALVALGKFPAWKIGHYFLGQYIGGFLATAVAYLNHYSAISVFDGGVRSAFFNSTSTAGILTSHPAIFLPLSGVVIDQIVCCALLQLGILCIVDHNNLNTPKPLIPISLFILLAGLIAAFGLNCGPALNPARDIPARLFAYIVGYGPEVWAPHSHLYWFVGGLISPHLGGILGSWIYHLGFGLHLPDPDEKYWPKLIYPYDCTKPFNNSEMCRDALSILFALAIFIFFIMSSSIVFTMFYCLCCYYCPLMIPKKISFSKTEKKMKKKNSNRF